MKYRLLSWPTLVLTLGAFAGCASSGLEKGDRFFEARAYREAAEAYEGVLSAGEAGPHLERVLFHLALLHASPESPLYDESRARELFEELVRRVDSGPYRSQAARILELETRRDELLAEAEIRRRESAAALEEASAQGRLAQERHRAALAELRRTVERLDGEVSECREQLEKLKAIDLDGSL